MNASSYCCCRELNSRRDQWVLMLGSGLEFVGIKLVAVAAEMMEEGCVYRAV